MTIIPLSEGSFTIDATKIFLPFDPGRDRMAERAKGSLLVEIQPFAVITLRDVILIDTGLGFYNPDGKMQIHHNLEANGINPSLVTMVLLSHLHKDHAGGIQDERNGRLSFPAAKYYVTANELSFAKEDKSLSYEPQMFSMLHDSAQTVKLQDSGTIDDYIHYETTGGHSKYHCVFRIEEAGEILFYGGDVAPQLQQMKNRFVAKYDFNGKKSMEFRQDWWEKGRQNSWTFLFYHDIRTPFVKSL